MEVRDDTTEIAIFSKEEVDNLEIAFDHRKIIEDSGCFENFI